jgi:hypothetical protein
MIRVITRSNLDLVLKRMSGYNRAIILGKGPTFKPIESNCENTLNIAINQTINKSDHIDMLVVNDFEIADDINLTKIKDLKYLLITKNPHKEFRPSDALYTEILKNFADHASPDLCAIVHNVGTAPIDYRFIFWQDGNEVPGWDRPLIHPSSANTAALFISDYLKNVKHVDLYGVGITDKDPSYSSFFKNENSSVNTSQRIKDIRCHLEKVLSCRNVNFY